jgi:hypothetical protein
LKCVYVIAEAIDPKIPNKLKNTPKTPAEVLPNGTNICAIIVEKV